VPAEEFFDTLPEKVDPDQIREIDNSYLFDIAGEGRWLVDVRSGTLTVTPGWEGDADATIATSGEVFDRLVAGTQNPMTAYMTGKLKISGDLSVALKLKSLF
jgi:putative sterol carrier protein